MAKTPEWIRKAAIQGELSRLLEDPDAYLTAAFGLQSRRAHVVDLADHLYKIATDTTEED